MPLIPRSSYRAKGLFRNAHFNTAFPPLFRKVEGLVYERERITTPDEDFLDLDWSRAGSDQLLLILHGLEGNSGRSYVKGMARYFNHRGWDALALNFRGCSGEPNLLLRSYHVGETGDLHFVLQHALRQKPYRSVALVGFSLGGNVLLKYMGEQPSLLPEAVKCGVAISVPCEVSSANEEINKWYNWPYQKRFMDSLNEKARQKARQFPGQAAFPEPAPQNFRQFDGAFTAPIHGFQSAEDYWGRNSSLQFLPAIERPVLLLNALDDSFLSQACYPAGLAERHPYFHLEMPRWGGHVGFVSNVGKGAYWSEQRAFAFIHQMAS